MPVLLERTEALVGDVADPALFCRGLLVELSRSLGGVPVVLWRVIGGNRVVRVADAGRRDEASGVSAEPAAGDDSQLRSVSVGQVVSLPARDGVRSRGVACAAELVNDAKVVLELGVGEAVPPKQFVLEVLDVFAELDRRTLLSLTLTRSERFGATMRFVSDLHQDLDRQSILNTFATDGAKLLSAQRVFVAQRQPGRKWSVQAASNVEAVNARADDVRGAATRIEEGPESDTAGVVMGVGDDWQRAEWAVLIESDEELDRPSADLLVHHLGLALANCRKATEATVFGRLKRLPSLLLRPSSLLTMAFLAACVGWLIFGEVELKVRVLGQAQPVERRILYANEGGVITAVRFVDEQTVREGDILAEMRNEELELEKERLTGEIARVQTRLAALETVRSGDGRTSSTSVSAEQAELRIELDSLQKQTAIVDRRIEELVIRAPMSGQVFSDQPVSDWLGRPMARGEPFVTVADRGDKWRLELRIPERDVRHVMAALEAAGEAKSVRVDYVFETSADVERTTTLDALDLTAQVDDVGELSTRATAAVIDEKQADRDDLNRPGAGVVAAIACGKRSPGFVYFRRVIEFLQRQVGLW